MSSVSEWSAVEDGNTHLDQYDLEKQINPYSHLNRYTKKIMAAVKAKADELDDAIAHAVPQGKSVVLTGDASGSGTFDADGCEVAVRIAAATQSAAGFMSAADKAALDVLKKQTHSNSFLNNGVVAGQYDATSSSQDYAIAGCQGFTIDTTRDVIVVGIINSDSSYQELRTLNKTDLSTISTKSFTTLSHVNSLCYIPSADEIYVAPLLRDGQNRLLFYVLDASDLTEKGSVSVSTPANVGQVGLSYDKARRRFVLSQPVTLNSSNEVIAREADNQNGVWIRVCTEDFTSIDEFVLRAPNGFLFGTGNGAACKDGLLVGASFSSVYRIDLDAKRIVSWDEAQVDRIEIEDFDFDSSGVLWGHANPGYVVFYFSNEIATRKSIGEIDASMAEYFPASLDQEIDLNTFVVPGRYLINTSGSNLTNAPSGINGLLVVEGSAKLRKQIWMRWGTVNVTDHILYTRTLCDGSWSRWHQVMTDEDVFYLPGDSVDITYSAAPAQAHGWVTSGGKDVYVQLLTNKRLSKINTITVTKLKGLFRIPSGGYAPSSSAVDFAAADSGYTVTASVMFASALRIKISKATAIDNFVNNTPVAMSIDALGLSFDYV